MAPAPTPTAPASPSLKFITAVKSEAQWDEQVMSAPGSTLCVCDIYSKWCGPCVALGKRITNLSSDYMEYAAPLQTCLARPARTQRSRLICSPPKARVQPIHWPAHWCSASQVRRQVGGGVCGGGGEIFGPEPRLEAARHPLQDGAGGRTYGQGRERQRARAAARGQLRREEGFLVCERGVTVGVVERDCSAGLTHRQPAENRARPRPARACAALPRAQPRRVTRPPAPTGTRGRAARDAARSKPQPGTSPRHSSRVSRFSRSYVGRKSAKLGPTNAMRPTRPAKRAPAPSWRSSCLRQSIGPR